MDDAAFVTLAEQQHHVVGVGHRQRRPDGFSTIGDEEQIDAVTPALLAGTNGYFCNDGHAIFTTGVFVADKHYITILGSDFPLLRAFLAITFTRRTKYHN